MQGPGLAETVYHPKPAESFKMTQEAAGHASPPGG